MSWPIALRIARREARRARGRSALVVAMIALPVLGVAAADITIRTFELSPDQQATREIGAADGKLDDTGQTVVLPQAQGWETAPGAKSRPALDERQLLSVLPPGSRLLLDHTLTSATGQDSVRRGAVAVDADTRQLAWDDPLAKGIYVAHSGRAARDPDEVVLTTALAARLHTRLGDTVQLASPAHQLTVVGTVADGSRTDALTALLAPGALEPQLPATTVLVRSSRPLTWADAQVAARRGIFLTGRGGLPGAPPAPSSDGSTTRTVTAAVLVGGMALLEVVLLAGPAFAVGAKRQSRELALLQTSGAQRRDVRRTVLASGLVLGLVGAVVGLGLGVVVAKLAVPVLTSHRHQVPGPFELPPGELTAVVALGVLTALLAAVLPAVNASRQDVLAALTGRRGTRRSSPLVPLAGVLVTALGAAVTWYAAQQRNTLLLLAGSVVAELGLVATTPALVGLAGRLGPLLPAVPRMALRDASRQRSRTAPAVAAVLAGVAGSVAVGTYVASLDGYDRARYTPHALHGQAVVTLTDTRSPAVAAASAAAVQRALSSTLPVRTSSVVQGTTATSPDGTTRGVYLSVDQPPESVCPLNRLQVSPTEQQVRAARADARCQDQPYGRLGTEVVGDAATVAALTGVEDPRVQQVLDAGGIVAPSSFLQADGRARVRFGAQDGQERVAVLPAYGLPGGSLTYDVVSPATARLHGAVPTADGVVVTFAEQPDSAQLDRARAALLTVGIDPVDLYVETGYSSSSGPVLLALLGASTLLVLGASGIATGLAAADGRADLATLAAVGASPGLRRALAGFQSATTAVLGTVLGAVAGFVPAIGLIHATNSVRPSLHPFPTVLPWSNLAVTLLVVPVVAALAAAAVTRSRLPLVRRLA